MVRLLVLLLIAVSEARRHYFPQHGRHRVVPHPFDCTRYIYGMKHQIRVFNCPYKLYYNPWTGICQHGVPMNCFRGPVAVVPTTQPSPHVSMSREPVEQTTEAPMSIPPPSKPTTPLLHSTLPLKYHNIASDESIYDHPSITLTRSQPNEMESRIKPTQSIRTPHLNGKLSLSSRELLSDKNDAIRKPIVPDGLKLSENPPRNGLRGRNDDEFAENTSFSYDILDENTFVRPNKVSTYSAMRNIASNPSGRNYMTDKENLARKAGSELTSLNNQRKTRINHITRQVNRESSDEFEISRTDKQGVAQRPTTDITKPIRPVKTSINDAPAFKLPPTTLCADGERFTPDGKPCHSSYMQKWTEGRA